MKSITICAAAVLSGAAFAQSATTTESPRPQEPAQPSATGTQGPATDVRGNVVPTQQPQRSTTMGAGAASEPRGWGRSARSRDRTATLSPQSVIPGTENGGPN